MLVELAKKAQTFFGRTQSCAGTKTYLCIEFCECRRGKLFDQFVDAYIAALCQLAKALVFVLW